MQHELKICTWNFNDIHVAKLKIHDPPTVNRQLNQKKLPNHLSFCDQPWRWWWHQQLNIICLYFLFYLVNGTARVSINAGNRSSCSTTADEERESKCELMARNWLFLIRETVRLASNLRLMRVQCADDDDDYQLRLCFNCSVVGYTIKEKRDRQQKS